MACGACPSRAASKSYVYTAPDGKQTVYSSETEAKAAKARRGGDYKEQK